MRRIKNNLIKNMIRVEIIAKNAVTRKKSINVKRRKTKITTPVAKLMKKTTINNGIRNTGTKRIKRMTSTVPYQKPKNQIKLKIMKKV